MPDDLEEDDDYLDGMDPDCYSMGHDERETGRDEEFVYFTCRRCGAEWDEEL